MPCPAPDPTRKLLKWLWAWESTAGRVGRKASREHFLPLKTVLDYRAFMENVQLKDFLSFSLMIFNRPGVAGAVL